ncbi:ABC transporter permease [Microbacterium sp. ZW T5_56]|uniref:ABC transporter permease n=1 Tax=Microbacterium sp. ZW T5_56 TaxID=3378081 RepID=UPI00385354BB
MKTPDLIRTAIGNTFRARARTTLTVLAIFVGAFTLTLTSGIGTGINRYIDDTVSAIGASDVMSVTKSDESSSGPGAASEPREYDPDAVSAGANSIPGSTVAAMTDADLTALRGVDGVLSVEPVKSVRVDYVQVGEGKRLVAGVGTLVPGQTLQLAAGRAPDANSGSYEVAIPVDYVSPLGFADDADALGATVSLAITDAAFTQHTVTAEIVGVAEATLAGPGGSSLIPNTALTDDLYAAQQNGLPAEQQNRWSQATVFFATDATDAEIDALKSRLTDAGFTGVTTADQLGAFTTVIDAIVLILNGFAVIALLAAGFGIVNTLLMSVQERTREIGLMKAMGMGSGRIFALFSIEAAFIGFLGSAIGVVIAMIAGSAISSVLAGSFLSDLPGLTLVAFDPVTVALTIVLIMFVAFLAGTIPAARAAGKDPVDALRYE